MVQEGIPVVAEDLGGTAARQVVFHTDSGKALMRRLPATQFPRVEAEQAHQREAERIQANAAGITLFED